MRYGSGDRVVLKEGYVTTIRKITKKGKYKDHSDSKFKDKDIDHSKTYILKTRGYANMWRAWMR